MSETAVYKYRDEAGAVLYETVRYDPKDFRQRRYGLNGSAIWDLDGISRVPYNLPELEAAKRRDEQIIVVEGEKDADSLGSLGYTATTNAGGAGWHWTTDFLERFRDAHVIVVADNDDPGRAAAQRNANNLLSVSKDVYLIEHLPDAPDKGDVSDLIATGWTRAQFDAEFAKAPRIGPEDGEAILRDVQRFIERFVVTSKGALLAMALWILHTWVIDAADCTPYLSISSPQRQCGKTRSLEVLTLLVNKAFFTSRTSPAALIRKIAKDGSALLLDETDAAFSGNKEYSEVLRGILNAGHSRGGVATLCVGNNHSVRDFPVFGPKALAGIGKLPDTIADRSICIELQRRLPDEKVERFRSRVVQPEAAKLRERLALWASAKNVTLRQTEPQLPDQLSDRAQDGWEPLLAIADACAVGERRHCGRRNGRQAGLCRKPAPALFWTACAGSSGRRGLGGLRDL
jgi:hypothetical protein